MAITKEIFGIAPGGEEITKFRIENSRGAYIEVSNYGANLVRIAVPDREGKLTDVALGFDRLEPYFRNPSYFGGTIGRNANRIANAHFSIDGQEYTLAANENGNNLHSGPVSYNCMVWEVKEVSQEENSVTFGRISPDGEQGFPGNLNITVTYSFNERQEVEIAYMGVCDQTTVVNLTNHSYFNLSGQDAPSVEDTQVQILAESYTPTDQYLIPTGEIVPVEGTPMDFRTYKSIGEDLHSDFSQLRMAGGFDHNYILDGYESGIVRTVARAYSPASGISMEVDTDLPGLQFYSGNAIDDQAGKDGVTYRRFSGCCMETQYVPDGINCPNFIAPIVRPGEPYHTVTVYRFETK
ncbi:MAG: aldose epimerase family protein [Blautia sp.]